MLNAFVILLCVIIVLIWIHYKITYSYWTKRGVPCVRPVLPIVGNVYDVFLLRPAARIVSRIYNSLDEPFFGFYVFNRNVLLVKDPDLIKKICITDFNHFVNRGFEYNSKIDPLAFNIIHLKADDWKVARPKLTTPFNVSKVKSFFTVMNDSALEVMEELNRKYESGVDCEFLDVCYRFMVDCIMKTLFGVNPNCVKNEHSEFHAASQNILGVQFIKHVYLGIFTPWVHSLLGVTMCSAKSTKLFKSVVCDSIQFRKDVESNSKDFFQTLMQMKEQYEAAKKANLKVEGPVIDENFITSQVFIFFTAGFETPANTMTFCMYELTQNKEVQEKVYKEITNVLAKHENQLTYEALQEMKYTHQVVAETMRKYPPLSLVFRQCTKDYNIPDTDVTIEAGTLVLMPAHGIHYDPKHYPNPEVFDPDRFSEKEVHPGKYFPFGLGPRNCPAALFANNNMKILLVRILREYKVSLSERTKLPFGFNPLQFVLTPQKSGVWLKLEKRKT